MMIIKACTYLNLKAILLYGEWRSLHLYRMNRLKLYSLMSVFRKTI